VSDSFREPTNVNIVRLVSLGKEIAVDAEQRLVITFI